MARTYKAYNVRLKRKEKILKPIVGKMKVRGSWKYMIRGKGKSGDKLNVFTNEEKAWDAVDDLGQRGMRTFKKKSRSKSSGRRKSRSRSKSSGRRKKSSGRRRKSSGRKKSGRKNSSGRKSYPKSKNCKKNITKARAGKWLINPKTGRVVKADGSVGCKLDGPFMSKTQAKAKAKKSSGRRKSSGRKSSGRRRKR